MKKDYSELTFTDDFMFRKVMENYPDVARKTIELLLGAKIKKVSKVVIQKPAGARSDRRGVRFDAYLEDGETIYDIEMQVQDEEHLAKRSRYYHSAIDVDQLKPQEVFGKLKTTYVIFICKNKLGDDFDKPIYTFTMRAKEELQRELGDGTITVLVNPYYKGGEISEELKAFLEYVRTGGIDSDDSFTSKIDNLVDELHSRGDWRNEYMTLYEMIEEAKAEGRAEGEAKGRAEGEAKVLAAAKKLGFDIDSIIAEVKSAEKN